MVSHTTFSIFYGAGELEQERQMCRDLKLQNQQLAQKLLSNGKKQETGESG